MRVLIFYCVSFRPGEAVKVKVAADLLRKFEVFGRGEAAKVKVAADPLRKFEVFG